MTWSSLTLTFTDFPKAKSLTVILSPILVSVWKHQFYFVREIFRQSFYFQFVQNLDQNASQFFNCRRHALKNNHHIGRNGFVHIQSVKIHMDKLPL